LRLKRPSTLGLKIDDVPEGSDDELPSYSAGQTVKVSGTTKQAGTLLVEIAYERGRLRHRPSIRGEYDSSDDAFRKIHQDYLKANDSVVQRKQLAVEAGAFKTDLVVPADCKGKCEVRVMLLGASDVAIDSVPIRILSDRQSRSRKAAVRSAEKETDEKR